MGATAFKACPCTKEHHHILPSKHFITDKQKFHHAPSKESKLGSDNRIACHTLADIIQVKVQHTNLLLKVDFAMAGVEDD